MPYRRVDLESAPEPADPADPTQVRRVTFVLFLSDGRVVTRASGPADLSTGDIAPGEHWLIDAGLRIPLHTHGFHRQRTHTVGIDELPAEAGGGLHVYAFTEGAGYRGRRAHTPVELETLAAEELAERLERQGDRLAARVVRDCADAFAHQSDESYDADNARLLVPAYLLGDTPQAQSGKGGDAAEWRRTREAIVDGIDRDGTFLDLGCANGLLMETVHAWAAERGLAIEPYGMDIGAPLVDLARERLPRWADRLWTGNATSWVPPGGRRFTFVHTLTDFVLPRRRGAMIRHILDTMVEPGGRLLVSQYGWGEAERPAREQLEALGHTVAGESDHTAWIDVPSRGSTSSGD